MPDQPQPTQEQVIAAIQQLAEQNQQLAQAVLEEREARASLEQKFGMRPAAPPAPPQGAPAPSTEERERIKQQLRERMLAEPVDYTLDMATAIEKKILAGQAEREAAAAQKAAAAAAQTRWEQDWLQKNRDIADAHVMPTFETFLRQQNPDLPYEKAVELAAQNTRAWLESARQTTFNNTRQGAAARAASSMPAPGGFAPMPAMTSAMDEQTMREEMFRKTRIAAAKKRGLLRVA